jgi:FHA domain
MATVTFQVLDGLEAGRLYCDLLTPISIGREEDNDIRLNDDRVSRFHAKIQDDAGRVIMTDLDSTNGTRINGHPVRSPEQLASLHETPKKLSGSGMSILPPDDEEGTHLPYPQEPVPQQDPFGGHRPEVPGGLTPLQAVQVSDLLSYIRANVLYILESGEDQKPVPLKGNHRMTVPPEAWHLLQKIQLDLSQYLREISEPGR